MMKEIINKINNIKNWNQIEELLGDLRKKGITFIIKSDYKRDSQNTYSIILIYGESGKEVIQTEGSNLLESIIRCIKKYDALPPIGSQID